MPSSVSGRLISGSWTVARAALMASSAGEPVSVSDIVCVCLLRRGTPARGGLDLRDRVACHCTAGNGSGRPAEGDPGRTPSGASLAGVSSAVRSRVLRDAVGLGLAVGLYGAAFGAAAVAAGLDVWQASTLSLLMFTGASQFALVGVLGAGGSALAAIGSALLLGTRNTVYGVRLVPLLPTRGVLAPAGDGALGHRRDDGAGDRRPRPGDGPAGVPRRRRLDLRRLERDHGARRPRGGRSSAEPPRPRSTPSSRPRSSPCCGRGCSAPSRRPPSSAGWPLGGAVVALALTPFVPPGVQVIAAVVAVALAGRPRRGGRYRRERDGALDDGRRGLAGLLPAEAGRAVGAGVLGGAAVGGPGRRLRAGGAARRAGRGAGASRAGTTW